LSNRLVAVFTPFADLTDPRIVRTRAHELFGLVVVALGGTRAGADSWTDIERFGNERPAWLRTFLSLAEGIPSHDTFVRVFARLDPAELMACFAQSLQDIGRDIGQQIAIDGKTLRGSCDNATGRRSASSRRLPAARLDNTGGHISTGTRTPAAATKAERRASGITDRSHVRSGHREGPAPRPDTAVRSGVPPYVVGVPSRA